MEKENKYFKPDIEDIKVGYEIESHEWSMDEAGIPELNYDRWVKQILNKSRIDTILKYGISGIRVPYLTKEQIEKEGWKEGEGYYKTLEFGNDFATYYCALFENNKIRISEYTKTSKDDMWSMQRRSIVFEGECKDINTFRYICKLLGI